MPRLIRRRPLWERTKDYLNPADWLLWASEEIETADWDNKQFATPLSFGLHLVLLIARANSGRSAKYGGDDVFGDDYAGTGWLSYIATAIVYLLTLFSVINTLYTFTRRRHYRLFESSVEATPSTPSARRVRVDSSPVSSSPLRLLSSILGDSSAESRVHPDPTRDVWEIAVWDPIPACLRLFCFFSPGHVLVYWLFLPTAASDVRPSVTVLTTIILQVLLSSQLFLLQMNFSQQEEDSAIIHKEVMSEYDIKYVHPRLHPLVRDVGTQYTSTGTDARDEAESMDVDTYTPTVILSRGFRTNPNPNYAKYIDPDNSTSISRRSSPAPAVVSGFTPSAYNSREPTPSTGTTPRPLRQPQFRQSLADAAPINPGDGGSLGVFTHPNSPLKKASSMYDIGVGRAPKNSLEMANREILQQRERSKSPAKRQSEAPRSLLGNSRFAENERRTSVPSEFGLKHRSGNIGDLHRRGPSTGPSRF